MNSHPDFSRRAFLAQLPVVTAGLAVPAFAAAETATPGPHWAMLVDTRRCIACQACTMGCAMENALPEGQFRTVVATYAVRTPEGQT
ncbi:MAG: tetrathionate reductase subunit B, partial [Hydrogenophaga sp.]|nr:tetrathionate reductase subunit B [Hydrogenophaga sp.]